jgi:hypothetical protein
MEFSMAKTMKELLAAKKAGGAAAPAAKVAPKGVVKKPAPAPVEETEEEEQTEGEEGGEAEEEEVAAPAPKKVVGKVAPKKAAPAPVEETEEEEQSEEEGEEGGEAEEEEEVAAPAPKKVVGKVAPKAAAPAAKVAPKAAPAPAAKKAPAAAAAPAAKKGGGWAKKEQKEQRVLEPGQWMPADMFVDLLHEKLVEKDIAPPTKAMTAAILKTMEETMGEVLVNNDLKFLGVKSKRRQAEARVYAPNPGLDKVATPYHTMVSPHTKVSFSLYFDKTTSKGQVNDAGEFEEGAFDDEGNFILGTWNGDEFTPAAKKVVGKKK